MNIHSQSQRSSAPNVQGNAPIPLVVHIPAPLQVANTALLGQWPSLQRTLATGTTQTPAAVAVTVGSVPNRATQCEIQVHFPLADMGESAQSDLLGAVTQAVKGRCGDAIKSKVLDRSSHTGAIRVEIGSDEARRKLDHALASVNVLASLVQRLGGGPERLAALLRNPAAQQVVDAIIGSADGEPPCALLHDANGRTSLALPTSGELWLAALKHVGWLGGALVEAGLHELAVDVALGFSSDEQVFAKCFVPLFAAGRLPLSDKECLSKFLSHVLSPQAIECFLGLAARLCANPSTDLQTLKDVIDGVRGLEGTCPGISDGIHDVLTAHACAKAEHADLKGALDIVEALLGRYGENDPDAMLLAAPCLEAWLPVIATDSAFDPDPVFRLAARYKRRLQSDRTFVDAPVLKILHAVLERGLVNGRLDWVKSCAELLFSLVEVASRRLDYQNLKNHNIHSGSGTNVGEFIESVGLLADTFMQTIAAQMVVCLRQGDKTAIGLIEILAHFRVSEEVLLPSVKVWVEAIQANPEWHTSFVLAFADACMSRLSERPRLLHLFTADALVAVFEGAMKSGSSNSASAALDCLSRLLYTLQERSDPEAANCVQATQAQIDLLLKVVAEHNVMQTVASDPSREALQQLGIQFSIRPGAQSIELGIDKAKFDPAEHGKLMLDYACALEEACASLNHFCAFLMPVVRFLMVRYSSLPLEVRQGLSMLCGRLQEIIGLAPAASSDEVPGARAALQHLSQFRLLVSVVAALDGKAPEQRTNALCWLWQNRVALFGSLPEELPALLLAKELPQGMDPGEIAVDAGQARLVLRQAAEPFADILQIDHSLSRCWVTLVGNSAAQGLETKLQAALVSPIVTPQQIEAVKGLLGSLVDATIALWAEGPSNWEDARRVHAALLDAVLHLGQQSTSVAAEIAEWGVLTLTSLAQAQVEAQQFQAAVWSGLAAMQLTLGTTPLQVHAILSSVQRCATLPGVICDGRVQRALVQAIEILAARGESHLALQVLLLRRSMLARAGATLPAQGIDPGCLYMLTPAYLQAVMTGTDFGAAPVEGLRALLDEFGEAAFARLCAEDWFMKQAPHLVCAGHLHLSLVSMKMGDLERAQTRYLNALNFVPDDLQFAEQMALLFDEYKVAASQITTLASSNH